MRAPLIQATKDKKLTRIDAHFYERDENEYAKEIASEEFWKRIKGKELETFDSALSGRQEQI